MCKPEFIIENLKKIDQDALKPKDRAIIQRLITEIESDLNFLSKNTVTKRLDSLISTTQDMIRDPK